MGTIKPKTKGLRCPSCQNEPLKVVKNGLRCEACQTKFPEIDGSLWLFGLPNVAIAEWQNQLNYYFSTLDSEANRLHDALANHELSELTHRRLSLLEEGKRRQIRSCEDLLAGLVERRTAPPETYEALTNKLPVNQNILAYYDNVFRDWCWGESENSESLLQLKQLCDQQSIQWEKPLVLGTGAGRLAHDLATAYSCPEMTLFDINPLLMNVSYELFNGKSLELVEFPLNPTSIEHVAVSQKLSVPTKLTTKFHYILGDIGNAPFIDGGQSTIITPWLVDILPYSIPAIIQQINRMLAVGGKWIFQGPTAFQSANPADQFSREEFLREIENTGFKILQTTQPKLGYMQSPYSCHGRIEKTLILVAEKTTEVSTSPKIEYLPDWIRKTEVAIPLYPEISSLRQIHQIPLYVFSQVDGINSIQTIAKKFSQEFGLSETEAEKSLQTFFTSVFEKSLIFSQRR